jgi:hypothetical protein
MSITENQTADNVKAEENTIRTQEDQSGDWRLALRAADG